MRLNKRIDFSKMSSSGFNQIKVIKALKDEATNKAQYIKTAMKKDDDELQLPQNVATGLALGGAASSYLSVKDADKIRRKINKLEKQRPINRLKALFVNKNSQKIGKLQRALEKARGRSKASVGLAGLAAAGGLGLRGYSLYRGRNNDN